ncbi:VOC family protein [Streptomyces alboflavus]|uniref:VOC family protein n=1 Tax=Streptomyces alboflavus TaxID=67267 RepID=UPI0036B2316E
MSTPAGGSVIWIEIDTADVTAVKDFYGSLFGWSFPAMPTPDGGTYHLIQPAGAPFPMGGILESGSGEREGIVLSAVSLDVAGDAARLKDLGATVVVPPSKAADGGDYARLTDPRGNLFAIWTPPGPPPGVDPAHPDVSAFEPKPGSLGWFEIGTRDLDATRTFYAQGLDWSYEPDPGVPGETYDGVRAGTAQPSGGLRELDQATGAADYTMPLFLTEDVPATADRAVALGARVEDAPTVTTYGLTFARLADPRGNRFGLFAPPQG